MILKDKKKSAGKDTAGKNMLDSLKQFWKWLFLGSFISQSLQRDSAPLSIWPFAGNLNFEYLYSALKTQQQQDWISQEEHLCLFPSPSPAGMMCTLPPHSCNSGVTGTNNHGGSTKQSGISWRIKGDWTVFTFQTLPTALKQICFASDHFFVWFSFFSPMNKHLNS